MKKTNGLTLVLGGLFAMSFSNVFAQDQNISKQDSIAIEKQTSKTDNDPEKGGDRNVMLNAANNSGPRDVNIGLPASVGGITILENDLPLVYFFWPELPNKSWRQSVSLKNTGLLKMEDLALSMGDLGFAVNSYTQNGTKDFHVKGNLSGSHFGWFQGDVNVSGPISKNGWTYSAGAFVNFDPSTYDLGFNKYVDQTKIFRAGVTKYFKDDKGEFNIFYKYADSYINTNYAVFEYGPNGEASEVDGFDIGNSSYIVRDGKLRFKDAITGDYYWGSLDGAANTNTSHTVDVFGNYKLDNGWNFKYSTRMHLAKASLMYSIPLSIFTAEASDGYTIASTGETYTGNVGTQLAMNSPEIPTTHIMGRFSLNKKIKNHDLTFGILEQYYHVDKYHSNRSLFFQTVEDQPQRLIGPGTDESGFYAYNTSAEYFNGAENKLAVYGNDSWQVSDKFKLKYGLMLRHQLLDGDYSPTTRTTDWDLTQATTEDINKSFFHVAGSLNASYNITKNFGALANFLYTEENGRLESFSTAVYPSIVKSRSPLAGAGIFWNTDYFSLVSQATYLTKNNYLTRYNLVNPEDDTETQQATIFYKIQTLGWTTDMMITPFKGFNLHYLITFQDPVYKDFTFSAFGNDYDYSDNTVLEISNVLMEIDPSYSVDKWRFWASFRYFSKQYANITNALYFAPRWENFGGINYQYNDHIGFGATVVNFLNQTGAKGTINGAELIDDASQYYGQLLSGSYIRPFTVQLSVNFNF
ncbi:Outer membrane receptor proteins, mostly Fe transport [Pustulibacterium marinum]|uniref:Outer membrane receptor proteins, mostly Fe transport n=1 Tax=Pustulibacterium marinum TaxID=1224947 RepID=A0A1I7I2I6_9FLAO|nr:TonB-dependent receptor [Pustulibacterium marinum]SFU67169.1 Outer membrane receptor proteins, mostly Fe transport [Pustulibacterium marinum]